MPANSTQQLACTHPGRDVAIVSLCAVVVSLVAVIVVMAFHGNPLATFGASGSAFAAAFSGGMGVLSHLKRTA
ncbi:hypothetical protein OH768_53210 [Streptomyces sp. NBC_01622]|uniref:hypothetical protein n=1 Tax=Streptomyces TaxID=1883 RepID=UPI0036BFA807|nr:hypothetical protein OG588_34105 [Streptomyces prunicolor]WTE48539.1 hypothetical protein OH768_53210 [Streptomyces sp. NBC_01622]